MIVKNTRLILAGLALLTPGLAAQEPLQVTLDEAVELALRKQPGMVSARGAITNALASRRQVTASWFPTVSSSSSMTLSPATGRFDPTTQTIVAGGSTTSFSGSLSASLVVFDGFRRNAQGKAANADTRRAEASLESQQFQTVLQTKQAFFGVLEGVELVRVAERRIERAERQLEISRNLLAAGSAIRSDTLRSTVELANARLQRLNAETGQANSAANLARLVGHDGPIRVVVEEGFGSLMTLDTASLRQRARDSSPAIRQATAQLFSAEAQVRISRAQYFPSVNASYRRSLSGQELSELSGSWSASVGLSFPIFNGFARETNMQRSRVSAGVARAQVEDSRRQVDALVTQQFFAHASALTRVSIARSSLLASREDLRVQQERYRVGLATIVDILASQINVDQAETDGVQAQFAGLLAQAAIESLVGGDL